MNADIAALLYLVAGVLFIQALRGLSSPESSRRGNMLGIAGMVIAIGTTMAAHPPAGTGAWILVVAGLGLGGGIGAVIARKVPMTSMPELVAAFHSLVGMAAVLVAAGAFYAPTAFGIGTYGHIHTQSLIEMSIGVAFGAITFTGSVIAFLKLSGRMYGVRYPKAAIRDIPTLIDHYVYGNQNAVELLAAHRPIQAKNIHELAEEIPRLRQRFSWVLELPILWARDLDRYLIRLGRLSA